jgi:hypothetical protein
MNGGVRQQYNMTGALDSQGQMPLVLGTIARNAPGNDLAALGHKKS